jgi:hypothetical protein
LGFDIETLALAQGFHLEFCYYMSMLHKNGVSNIVTCLLKAEITETEKTQVATQRLGKYTCLVTDMYTQQ